MKRLSALAWFALCCLVLSACQGAAPAPSAPSSQPSPSQSPSSRPSPRQAFSDPDLSAAWEALPTVGWEELPPYYRWSATREGGVKGSPTLFFSKEKKGDLLFYSLHTEESVIPIFSVDLGAWCIGAGINAQGELAVAFDSFPEQPSPDPHIMSRQLTIYYCDPSTGEILRTVEQFFPDTYAIAYNSMRDQVLWTRDTTRDLHQFTVGQDDDRVIWPGDASPLGDGNQPHRATVADFSEDGRYALLADQRWLWMEDWEGLGPGYQNGSYGTFIPVLLDLETGAFREEPAAWIWEGCFVGNTAYLGCFSEDDVHPDGYTRMVMLEMDRREEERLPFPYGSFYAGTDSLLLSVDTVYDRWYVLDRELEHPVRVVMEWER